MLLVLCLHVPICLLPVSFGGRGFSIRSMTTNLQHVNSSVLQSIKWLNKRDVCLDISGPRSYLFKEENL